MSEQATMLLDTLPDGSAVPAPKSLSKKGFAERLGLTPGRISQMITAGLPVQPDGRINIERGEDWYRANVDPNRRRAPGEREQAANLQDENPRYVREQAEAQIAQLKAEKLAGNLLDRKAMLIAIEGRARMERDAWIGFVNRSAPELARVLNVPLDRVQPLLERLVRDQLASLAEMPLMEATR